MSILTHLAVHWPWTHTTDHTSAQSAVAVATAGLQEIRNGKARVQAVTQALAAERANNHFAERILAAFEQGRDPLSAD